MESVVQGPLTLLFVGLLHVKLIYNSCKRNAYTKLVLQCQLKARKYLHFDSARGQTLVELNVCRFLSFGGCITKC